MGLGLTINTYTPKVSEIIKFKKNILKNKIQNNVMTVRILIQQVIRWVTVILLMFNN